VLAGHPAASKGRAYVEETEILAFDCFWQAPQLRIYGPRNKKPIGIFWTRHLVEDAGVRVVFEQFDNRKLRSHDRAGR